MSLFARLEELQGTRPWGRILDAGTGWSSLEWALSLPSQGVWAVTGSAQRKQGLERDFSHKLGSEDRLIVGNWVEASFLQNEKFDSILVDYLVGSLDRFAPYFQTKIFTRLAPHLTGRMYLVGLEPYAEANNSPQGKLVQALVELRDAAILMTGDRPHREYPRWWVVQELTRAGYTIFHQESFSISYGKEFVEAELGVVRDLSDKLPTDLRQAFDSYEKELRRRIFDHLEKVGPLHWGQDYIIGAELAARKKES